MLITGINGTGKTTLLRLMAGVLLPQSGTIEYAQELGEDPRAKIGFISDKRKEIVPPEATRRLMRDAAL